MGHIMQILLIAIALLIIGCNEDNNQKNSSITINKIEKKITNQETKLGCSHEEDNSSEECTEEGITDNNDAAQFILSTLERDLDKSQDKSEESNIVSIKENLSNSLEEMTKEENKKSELKDSLIALVNEVNDINKSTESTGKKLRSFVDNLDDTELGVSNQKRIASIRGKLSNLVDIKDSEIKPKEVKSGLENLIADVVESENSLIQTQKSLINLVEDVEKKNTPSVKKFADAIIEDVSSKRISIIDENENFFIIKVQQGDNLSILAKRYYNNRNKFKLIYEANRDKINSRYEIYPNSRLLIPKI